MPLGSRHLEGRATLKAGGENCRSVPEKNATFYRTWENLDKHCVREKCTFYGREKNRTLTRATWQMGWIFDTYLKIVGAEPMQYFRIFGRTLGEGQVGPSTIWYMWWLYMTDYLTPEAYLMHIWENKRRRRPANANNLVHVMIIWHIIIGANTKQIVREQS